MKKTYGKVLLVLVSILIFTSIAEGANNTSSNLNNSQDSNQSFQNRTSYTYRILVDGYNGFYRIYRVYDVMANEEITYTEYDNNTLNIHIGDTITWSNEDPYESLTMVSYPKLWENRTGYIGTAKIFKYKFNKAGRYDVYIRQHQELPHQKIIVRPSNMSDNIDIEEESDSKNVNRTVILKSEFEDSINDLQEQYNPKSRVVIKTYKKSKEIPGFGIIITMAILLSIYTYKKRTRRK